jgi:phosphoribosylformylglycinamidine synthase
MIDEGLVESAKDCTEGGLAVTLAESGFARGVGAQVTVASAGLVPEFVLFGEDASRILISCDQKNVERIKEVAVKYALSAEDIGSTVPDNLEITVDGKLAAAAPVSELKKVWTNALEEALHTEAEEQAVSGAV